jgi:hypothetical protein
MHSSTSYEALGLYKSTDQSEYTVTYPGFAWIIRRVFGFDVAIYWTFIPLVTTVQKSLADTLSSSSEWTLHVNYSDFKLNSATTPLYSLNSDLPLYSVLLITPLHEPHEDTFCCEESVFIGPLPNNEWPIVESVCFGNVFTEPLPSSGHKCHNTYWCFNIIWVYVL